MELHRSAQLQKELHVLKLIAGVTSVSAYDRNAAGEHDNNKIGVTCKAPATAEPGATKRMINVHIGNMYSDQLACAVEIKRRVQEIFGDAAILAAEEKALQNLDAAGTSSSPAAASTMPAAGTSSSPAAASTMAVNGLSVAMQTQKLEGAERAAQRRLAALERLQHLPPTLLPPPRAMRSDAVEASDSTCKAIVDHAHSYCPTSPHARDVMKRRAGPCVVEEKPALILSDTREPMFEDFQANHPKIKLEYAKWKAMLKKLVWNMKKVLHREPNPHSTSVLLSNPTHSPSAPLCRITDPRASTGSTPCDRGDTHLT